MTINNKLLLFLMITWLSVSSTHATTIDNQLTDHLKVVGQGEMSWLFIDIYQATLYSPSGRYEAQMYPQALRITYQKDIEKDHLINATEKEWQNLSLNNEQHPHWLEKLNKIWVDIKKDDQLLFMIEENGDGYFYHNNKLLGGVNNSQFSEDFLSIWLSKNTSEPALRQQLLGK